ncbi:unnamed protein product [Diamesa hyperborea]
MLKHIFILSIISCILLSCASAQKCNVLDVFYNLYESQCLATESTNNEVYILYSVNPVEGFNLRRDVYLRMAVFLESLRKIKGYENSYLVLPTFHHLYHWKSNFKQNLMFWNHFFDLDSLKMYTNVLDMWEFFEKTKRKTRKKIVTISEVYRLQHFENMFESGVFVDKFEETACPRSDYDNYHYFDYHNITENSITCLNFQGSATLLINVLEKYKDTQQLSDQPRIVLFANAETALHDFFGDEEYWKARRSMRFNNELITIANNYRRDFFESEDKKDLVQRPVKWINEKPYTGAVGGDYLCVHMRRGDFLHGREAQMPTLRSVAAQIKRSLVQLGLHKVFISSDCTGLEYKDLKAYLRAINVYKYKAHSKVLQEKLGDGGVAIIDQIICSNARKFIGTYESTFTYRIYEEREILGFPRELTFNTLCKHDDDLTDCRQNSVWPIRY